MKKAGNLKYGYERTNGEFIVIFDADFAPHPDFIYELLPYMSDPKIGIVQSPQYFEATNNSYRRSHLAYAAAYLEEVFYRVIQVAKDRFDAAICCGSNAIYRRFALASIGGPRQVDASEDSRTGFALLSKGWVTRYVPLILAVGICPDNAYAYFHQQHRWCRGRSSLVLSKEFLTAPVSFMAKICNLSGFLAFASQPLELIISFQLFWALLLYNQYISLENWFLFYPYVLFSLVLFPLLHIIRIKKEAFIAATIRLYASTHALLGVIFGRSVAWIPTNVKHTNFSSAFRQAIAMVGVYFSVYWILIAISVRTDSLHLFDINYYDIQFWIIWNIVLSGSLLWIMYQTIIRPRKEAVLNGRASRLSSTIYQLKTAGLYILLLSVVFYVITLS